MQSLDERTAVVNNHRVVNERLPPRPRPVTIYKPKKRVGEIPNHAAIRQHDRHGAIGSRPIIQQRVIVPIRLEHRLERVVGRNCHRGRGRLGQSSRTSGEPRQRD